MITQRAGNGLPFCLMLAPNTLDATGVTLLQVVCWGVLAGAVVGQEAHGVDGVAQAGVEEDLLRSFTPSH